MASWLIDKFSDTLAKRLFLLIWGALVLSHLLAFAAVQLVHFSAESVAEVAQGQLPTFPSLPPTPGVPDSRNGHPPGEDMMMMDEEGPPQPARHGLPFNILLLDYGVRLIVIAIAAWYGSRWLATPMRRLVGAAQALGRDLDAPALDEQQGTREVRETAKVFNAMATQLRQQFRARGLMVAAISHDLRTPLTRLRMRLEMLDESVSPQADDLRRPPPEGGKSAWDGPALTWPTEMQAKSIADVREMNALIDTVLELFRGDGQAEAMQKTDIAALAQSLADDLIEQGQPVTFKGEAALTLAQPAALKRVLGNLIGNALRYGGRADITITQTAAELRITVDDAGPGIPAAQLDAVFEPFYRVESSRNQHTGGTGLGLYIARDLAQRQDGRITLLNRPEGGLRAELVLPRA